MNTKLFFNMIETLRKEEEVILYENLFEIDVEEKLEVGKFLQNEFQKEKLNYSFSPPSFSEEAAIWAAEVIYVASQLLLFRKNNTEELPDLFPTETPEINPKTILSADLCLRFLPSITQEIGLIDKDDPLLQYLESILKKWYFSAVSYSINHTDLDFEVVLSDESLTQMYLDRIVDCNNIELIKNPRINRKLKMNLSIYKNDFWSNYKEIIEDE